MEEKTEYLPHDRLFKELIQTFFAEFMEAFFPEVARWMDFSEVEFLQQDLFTDITAGEQHRIDILAKLKLKGGETIILIHVEPQSYYQMDFPERMFIYYSRIYEKYRLPVLPIAVFSYNKQKETPSLFTVRIRNFESIRFRYMSIHLIRKNWKEYIQSNNPVAAALLSKMGYTKKEKVQVKVEFLRMMARMELDPARMALIYGFFDSYFKLTDKEDELVMSSIKNLDPQETDQILRLPNSFYDKGYKKGKEEGKKEGKEEGVKDGERRATLRIAKRMLEKNQDLAFIIECTGLTEEELKKLKENEGR
jgi:predicted transposase YdaD